MELPEKIKHVSISSFGRASGELTHPGHYQFDYINTEAPPVSLTMINTGQNYKNGAVHPIFLQNLPEGFIRKFISEKLSRYADVNDMYLIALQRDNGIGHLTFQSELPDSESEPTSLNDILDWKSEEDLFPQLLEKYYLSGITSGMQPKVSMKLESKGVIHQQEIIVKSFDPEFESLPVNEFVCMSAAKHCGLETPDFWLSDDRKCFVISRFDRGGESKIGVEDFSVLMGKKSSADKYRSSYETVLKATARYTLDKNQIKKMFEYIVFSCMIGNGDAHLKNFSLVYDWNPKVKSMPFKNIIVSPLYDVTHTNIYKTLDGLMALKLNDSKKFPSYKDLVDLGMRCNDLVPNLQVFKITEVKSILDSMASSIRESINENKSGVVLEMAGLSDSILESVSRAMSKTDLGPRRDRAIKHI